jgi:mRNA interferase MazF
VRRGEVWTASGGPGYAGKPRPVLIVQDNAFDLTASITVCGLTSNPSDFGLTRIEIEPTPENGLLLPSKFMADKVTTMQKKLLGKRIGKLADGDMVRVNRAMLVFLGLAGEAQG